MNKVFLSSVLFFMLVSSVLVVEARPLGLTKDEEKLVAKFFDGLSLGAIKDSGPSSGGEGHHFVDRTDTLGYGKHSGPSSGGEGHQFVDRSETLGYGKHSGPSPSGPGH
ncbi:PAMP-induced secreted peptide 2 [Cardamine amara subsp. amara]|uniref:PAMP-induced secreted peptide 2 n=1 Tax=Cardamine amara subsp. amara TaxID=228776 RepID=A0ABD1BGC3_CARAN